MRLFLPELFPKNIFDQFHRIAVKKLIHQVADLAPYRQFLPHTLPKNLDLPCHQFFDPKLSQPQQVRMPKKKAQ